MKHYISIMKKKFTALHCKLLVYSIHKSVSNVLSYCKSSGILMVWEVQRKLSRFDIPCCNNSDWIAYIAKVIVYKSCEELFNIYIIDWDKSRVKWENSQNATQKMRTFIIVIWAVEFSCREYKIRMIFA